MKAETRTIVGHRLERAYDSLGEARVLFDQGYTNTCVSRLYYACFYAVSALLLTKGVSASKHTGIRSFFHQYFVKLGLMSKDFGKFYDRLFDSRQKGDYTDFFHFAEDEVSHWLEEAREFVEVVEKLVQDEIEKN